MSKGGKIVIAIGFALIIGVIVYFIVKTMKGEVKTKRTTLKNGGIIPLNYNVQKLQLAQKKRSIILPMNYNVQNLQLT